MQALYLLFQIDPTSLPRSEENLQSVAKDLQEHSDDLEEHCSQMRQQRRNLKARGKIYNEQELRRAAQSVSFKEYMQNWDDAISHYVRTGCLKMNSNSLLPNFFVLTRRTPVHDICGHKLFGAENDGGFSVDEPEHICEMAASVKGDDSDRSGGASWVESDIDSWSDEEGVDMLDDEEAFSDDEQTNHRRLPSGVDWTSILITRGDEWLIRAQRKEDCPYMMP